MDASSSPASNRAQFTHPKARRLRKREEFKRLFRARKFQGSHLLIEYCLRSTLFPRLGITITKQYGKAHDRNLFKRRIKEIFRHHSRKIPFGIDLNVRARSKGCSFADLAHDFETFIQSLGR